MSLAGPWVAGFVLDYHSVSATPTGDPYHPFEMKYTELGGRLYRFKYRNDRSVLTDIVDTVEDFVRSAKMAIDCVVPAPPSKGRASQPVAELAGEVAKRLGLPVFESGVVKVKETPSMKNIPDWLERQRVLEESVRLGPDVAVTGRAVLLLDDLVESGSTLRRAAEVLLKNGGAAAVCAVALTRTR